MVDKDGFGPLVTRQPPGGSSVGGLPFHFHFPSPFHLGFGFGVSGWRWLVVVILVILVGGPSPAAPKLTLKSLLELKNGPLFGILRRGLAENIKLDGILQPDHLALQKTPAIIRDFGYPFEEHRILSEDGYFTTVFRIPHGRDSVKPGGRPVFLQHGILMSSKEWFLHASGRVLRKILEKNRQININDGASIQIRIHEVF
jgi:Partial alpha/beta-hydrolase lipase region